MNNEITVIQSKLIGEQYEKISHRSGLDIYVFRKELTTAYAIFAVKYGASHTRFSTDGEKSFAAYPEGIAHFLEHKLFINADGSDSFERFSEYGADANAFTSANKTAYLFSCTENFSASLCELLDFVTHPYFTPETVSSELGIISEEIKMYEDSPQNRCFYGMLEGMYRDHSIKKNICGTRRSIKKITADMLYDCYNKFYNLNNMVLIVCGNVDTEEILAIADEHLPTASPPFSAVCRTGGEKEAPRAVKSYVESKMPISKPIFNIGFKDTDIPQDPFERQKKDAAMAILNEMLFSMAGDLYNFLFENELISPNISYGYTITKDLAYNSFAGEADDPSLVLEKIMAHIEALPPSALSERDFLRGKRVMYSEFVTSFDSSDSIANNLLSFVCDGAELLSYADIINSVTFEDVKKLYSKAFDRSSLTLSVVKPL